MEASGSHTAAPTLTRQPLAPLTVAASREEETDKRFLLDLVDRFLQGGIFPRPGPIAFTFKAAAGGTPSFRPAKTSAFSYLQCPFVWWLAG
jgi:hypothetical protein